MPVRYLGHGDVGRSDLFATGVLNVNRDADVLAGYERSTIQLQRTRHEAALTRTPAWQSLGVHSHTLLYTRYTPA